MSATENQPSNAGDAPEGNKGGKKKYILIAVLIIALAGSGGGFYYWRTVSAAKAAEAVPAETDKKDSKRSSAKKDAATETEEKGAGEKKTSKNGDDPLSTALPDDEDVKKIIELPPFIVNLADVDQARYLRMTVSLGVGGEEGGSEKPDQLFITRVRNAILAVLSNKKSDDVLTVDGKSKLRAELLKAAQAASEEPEVRAIYITDFIVQL
jgi:flagellar protein FliL